MSQLLYIILLFTIFININADITPNNIINTNYKWVCVETEAGWRNNGYETCRWIYSEDQNDFLHSDQDKNEPIHIVGLIPVVLTFFFFL